MNTSPHGDSLPVIDTDQAFPAMVDRGGAGSTSASSASDQTPQVRSVLREVLGLRTRTEDPKAFLNALSSSFTLVPFEGRVEARYVPHSFAASDLGYLSGGQASLYKRASVFGREISTMLDGLRALRPDADPDDTEAFRTLVRDAVAGAVDELGAAGGPRTPLVDSYFQVLTGSPDPDSLVDADTVGGQLGALRDRFGFLEDHVNGPVEEAERATFASLVDMVTDLHKAWAQNKGRFGGEPGRGYLGTELVWLSRLMEAAADQVDELELVLDSVMIGHPERRTIRFQDQMTLDGLLSWLRRFLTYDGRRIIADTGRDGIVTTLAPMALTLLRAFKRNLADPIARPSTNGFRRGDDESGGQRWDGSSPIVYLTLSSPDLPAGLHAARCRIAIASLTRLLTEFTRSTLQVGRYAQPVLLDVLFTQVQDLDDIVQVALRGLNLRRTLVPAFLAGSPGKAEGWRLEDVDRAELLTPLPGSVSFDEDTLSAFFHASDVRALLSSDCGDIAGLVEEVASVDGRALMLPGDALPLALIDLETGRLCSAVSYPDGQPSSRPVAGQDRSRWSRRFADLPAADRRDLSADGEGQAPPLHLRAYENLGGRRFRGAEQRQDQSPGWSGDGFGDGRMRAAGEGSAAGGAVEDGGGGYRGGDYGQATPAPTEVLMAPRSAPPDPQATPGAAVAAEPPPADRQREAVEGGASTDDPPHDDAAAAEDGEPAQATTGKRKKTTTHKSSGKN
jgi:hypothetical protein